MPKSNINDLLADAAYRGALDEVKDLLAQGAQINALTSSMKRTAIANAACNGQFEVIKYLLEQGADPLIRAEYQRTVLINAVSYIPSTNRENYLKTVALFLQYGVDVNAEDEDGQMALHYAVRYDAFDAALLIADHGAILSKANPFRNQVTPLMSTVCHQSDAALQFLERLLSNHVELEVRDKYGKTALVHALNAGNFTAASRLLKLGAKADAPDHKGTTPLMAALAHESCPAAIVDELLQAGDRLDAQDNVGNDLRMLTASKKYQPACREKLIQHGLVIDEPALHLIFDIDNTLAQGFSVDDLATLIKEKPYVAWFQNNNLLINAVHPHILFPGTLELMQYVFSIPQVKVSFFSGEMIRNKPFVAELLIRALGNSHYDRIKRNVRIVSTHDLPKVSKNYYEQQADNADHRYYGLQSGRVKKDLTVFLAQNQKLSASNILLVDDDESYISPQQVEHVLFVKGWPEFRHPQPAIAQSANQIFYIAGLLHKAMEQGESHHLRNYLFNQQFVKSIDKDGYRPNYRKLTTQEEFYQLGLSLLQKYNPNLSFYAQATQEFRAQLDLQEAQEQIRREEIQRMEQQQKALVAEHEYRQLMQRYASLVNDDTSRHDFKAQGLSADSSLFIKNVIECRNIYVRVLHGESLEGWALNMSMLRYFFAARVHGEETKNLFAGLAINELDCRSLRMQHQGKYSVIYLDFSDVKPPENVDELKVIFRKKISIMAREFLYLLDSEHLSSCDKKELKAIIDEHVVLTRFNLAFSLQDSLKILTSCIAQHQKETNPSIDTMIIINAYNALIPPGCDPSLSEFMRAFFSRLKDNPYYSFAILTGYPEEGGFSYTTEPLDRAAVLPNCCVHRLLEKLPCFSSSQQQVSGIEDGQVIRPLPSFFASSSDIPSGSGANQNDVSRSDLSPS